MLYIGEIAALATALCWALSTVLFRHLGGVFSPLNLNLWKGIISIVALFTSLFFISNKIPQTSDLLWLLLSGVIGIGIGDTAFFAALNRMGERSALLVTETLAPVFTAILAVFWISEILNAYQWLAIAIILLGVDLVLGARKRRNKHLHVSISALGYAAIAALCQAVGAVIGRDILIHSDVDSIMASLVRLVGGVFLVVVLISLSKLSYSLKNANGSAKQTWLPKQKISPKMWRYLFAATFVGTLLAMVLQMFSFAHTEAAIVQSLFASSIVFSLIIARIQGQEITRNAIVGSLIATVGVGLIFLS